MRVLGERLVLDPHLPWSGSFPYDCLNARLQEIGHGGIGPASTAREITDSFFDLMQDDGTTQEDQLTWNELRRLDRRLLMDFLLYHLPGASGESRDGPASIARVDETFAQKLLAEWSSNRIDPGPQPRAAPLDPDRFKNPPVDIGPVPCGEADVEKIEHE